MLYKIMDVLDIQEDRSSGGYFLSIALALMGVIVGGVALYFTLNSSATPTVHDDFSALEERVEMLQLKLEALTAENELLKTGLSRVVQQTQTALTQVGKEMTLMNEQHAQSRQALSKLATPQAKKGTPVMEAPKPNTTTRSSMQPQYVIQPGDTLAKIARRYGVSLQSILDLNPNVNPKALKIGQVIYLPENHS